MARPDGATKTGTETRSLVALCAVKYSVLYAMEALETGNRCHSNAAVVHTHEMKPLSWKVSITLSTNSRERPLEQGR